MNKTTVSVAIISLLLLACTNQKQTVENPDEVTFKTDDSSRLFFRNVRQIAYNKEEMDEAKLNVFRYKKRSSRADMPVLNLALVENWRYDEAYLLVEPNGFIKQSTINLKWENPATNQQGEISFTPSNKDSHQRFASEVYEKLQAKCEFEIKLENGWHKILHTPKQRDAFSATVFDYYRLTLRL